MRVLVGVVDQEQLRARRRGRVWGDQRQGVWIVVHLSLIQKMFRFVPIFPRPSPGPTRTTTAVACSVPAALYLVARATFPLLGWRRLRRLFRSLLVGARTLSNKHQVAELLNS